MREKNGPFYNYFKVGGGEFQSQAGEVALNWRRDPHRERKNMTWQ